MEPISHEKPAHMMQCGFFATNLLDAQSPEARSSIVNLTVADYTTIWMANTAPLFKSVS